ncbi:MAG: uroporphyrinogen decarboxylase family protein [Syntrophomonadaceae bacterium]|nr:uroporphyrinogen decarboxylase family protein [Syntrophomonadaceae bacterium]
MRLIDYIAGLPRRLVFPWMGSAGLRLTGLAEADVLSSASQQLLLARFMDREYPSDFVYPLDDGALLLDAIRPVNGMLASPGGSGQGTGATRPVPGRIPDPCRDGRIPVHLRALRLIAREFDKPLAVSVPGPFTLAAEMAGLERFLRAVRRDPSFVHEWVEFSTAAVAAYARAALAAGARFLCISEPTAALVSPAHFNRFVAGALRQLLTPLEAWKCLHVCGDTSHLLPCILECGAEALSLDQVMNLPEVAQAIPPEVVLMGNLDPLGALWTGTPAAVRHEVLSLLRAMHGRPNYIVSFGCDCVPDTPPANLKAALAAAQAVPEEYLLPSAGTERGGGNV